MIFHTHIDAASYVCQATVGLVGDVDIEAMQQAWLKVVNHNEVYRTAFVGEPAQQLVVAEVSVPWIIEDWRDLSKDEQMAKLDVFCEEDKQRGFDLTQAPLIRLGLIRLEEQRWRLVWSYHHVLIDGWSLPMVLSDMMDVYHSLVKGANIADIQLEERPAYENYIAWLDGQDEHSARDFWKDYLKSVERPTPLGIDKQTIEPGRDGAGEIPLTFTE